MINPLRILMVSLLALPLSGCVNHLPRSWKKAGLVKPLANRIEMRVGPRVERLIGYLQVLEGVVREGKSISTSDLEEMIEIMQEVADDPIFDGDDETQPTLYLSDSHERAQETIDEFLSVLENSIEKLNRYKDKPDDLGAIALEHIIHRLKNTWNQVKAIKSSLI